MDTKVVAGISVGLRSGEFVLLECLSKWVLRFTGLVLEGLNFAGVSLGGRFFRGFKSRGDLVWELFLFRAGMIAWVGGGRICTKLRWEGYRLGGLL